jgi:hypothetical protein
VQKRSDWMRRDLTGWRCAIIFWGAYVRAAYETRFTKIDVLLSDRGIPQRGLMRVEEALPLEACGEGNLASKTHHSSVSSGKPQL